jgi:hypothetical protein
MRKLCVALVVLAGLIVATPTHAVLCDAVFRASSCPPVQCDQARTCRANVLNAWTEARCMRSPAEAQSGIAAECEQCNQVCSSPTAWMRGTWRGEADQAGTSWSIQLTVAEGSISVAYPSLGCGGYWDLQSTGTGVATFIEYITYEKDKCVNIVNVTVGRLSSDRMQVRFSWPNGVALGTLTRQ